MHEAMNTNIAAEFNIFQQIYHIISLLFRLSRTLRDSWFYKHIWTFFISKHSVLIMLTKTAVYSRAINIRSLIHSFNSINLIYHVLISFSLHQWYNIRSHSFIVVDVRNGCNSISSKKIAMSWWFSCLNLHIFRSYYIQEK